MVIETIFLYLFLFFQNVGLSYTIQVWDLVQMVIYLIALISFFVMLKSKVDVVTEKVTKQIEPTLNNLDNKIKTMVQDAVVNERAVLTQESKNGLMQLQTHLDHKISEIGYANKNLADSINVLKDNWKTTSLIVQKHEDGITSFYRHAIPEFKKEIIAEMREILDQQNKTLLDRLELNNQLLSKIISNSSE